MTSVSTLPTPDPGQAVQPSTPSAPRGVSRRAFRPWKDASAKPFIELKGLTKRFGAYTAVQDLSLAIYEREFFALLGASGCGKSTLLRMLAGFEQPTSGQILLDGNDLSGIPPNHRPVNMMFQSYALFPHMTVEKNIAFGLRQERMTKTVIAERVAEMLKLVKLEQYSNRKPHQLSGGQKQRVALARSLAKRPKVLLLDEPLGALDKKLREETQFELMDLQQTLGLTFIVVTHDQEEAMTMADRIAVMDKGEFMQIATPEEVYEKPLSRHVASFIGTINLFEGIVGERSSTSEIVIQCNGRPILAPYNEELQPGQSVALAVRPEKLSVSRLPRVASNVFEGEIHDIAYLGGTTILHIRLSDGQIVRACSMNSQIIGEIPLSWGDRVWVSFSSDIGVVLTC